MNLALVYNAKGASPPAPRPRADTHAARELSQEEIDAECDSPETIAAVASALASGGHEVVPLDADEHLFDALRSRRFDFVFNLAEGRQGEAREAQVPAMLEFLGIPYTGSGPIALALAHDKARAKEVWLAHGLAAARGVTVEPGRELPRDLPSASAWIVKPIAEGSSKGVRDRNLVRSRADAAARVREIHERFRQAALVEEFLDGREFTVALLGNLPDVRVLPIVEIDFSALPRGAKPLYSFEAKWEWDRPENPLPIFRCPAELTDDLARRVSELAVGAFRALGCRDWARVDVRCDSAGDPHLLEINPLPGILPNPEENSCFPKAARAAGLRYEEALLAVLDAARERTERARAEGAATR